MSAHVMQVRMETVRGMCRKQSKTCRANNMASGSQVPSRQTIHPMVSFLQQSSQNRFIHQKMAPPCHSRTRTKKKSVRFHANLPRVSRTLQKWGHDPDGDTDLFLKGQKETPAASPRPFAGPEVPKSHGERRCKLRPELKGVRPGSVLPRKPSLLAHQAYGWLVLFAKVAFWGWFKR